MAKASDKATDADRQTDLLIQEVDEDLRRDQYIELWRRYGIYAVGAAVLLVAAVAAWQGWQWWQTKQRLEAASNYRAARALVEAGKDKEGAEALAQLAAKDNGFAVLAAMDRAELLARTGDVKGAQTAYEDLAKSNAPQLLRDLATLKEGLLLLDDKGDTGAIEGRVAALAVKGAPWYFQATEIVALYAKKKGDTAHALELFKQLADDAEAPQGVRARSAEMLAALGPAPAPPPVPDAEPKK